MFGINSKQKEQIKKLYLYEEELKKYEKTLKDRDDASRIHMLNPSRICPNPNQPRKNFDVDGLQSLSESIKRYGIIQPLTVRRISGEDTSFGGLYELIAGERRLRAARMLELPYVPCIIIEADKEESAMLSLVENIQRSGLDCFEEAEAIDALIRRYGVKQQDIAGLLSVSQSYVANKLRLLKLDNDERETAREYGLTERHIRAALKVQSKELRKKVLLTAASRGYNVRQTEQYVLELCGEKSREPAAEKIVIKDIRIFLNTIDKAVGIVRQAGIPVESTRSDGDGVIEVKIKVPANKK